MKIIMLIVFVTLQARANQCTFKDVTDGSKHEQTRTDLMEKENNAGVRIALTGIKGNNSRYGTATVNQTIAKYITKICKKLPNMELIKTDFKGFYIECGATTNCASKIQEIIKSSGSIKFPVGDEVLGIESVTANNYKEGYLKARLKSTYPDFKEPMDQFINEKIDKVLVEHNKLLSSSDAEEVIGRHIDSFRKDGIESVPKKFHDLINIMDATLETPFHSSQNIDILMEQALEATKTSEIDGKKPTVIGDYLITSAQTGDDKFIVIKKGNEVVKVIGADARGLGKVNMIERIKELRRHKKANGIGALSMKDIIRIGDNATTNANVVMDISLDTYEESIIDAIRSAPDKDIDELIKIGNEVYDEKVLVDGDMMHMRTTILSDCGTDKDKIMNQVSALHKRQKIFETYGRKVDIGASCIGLEYFLLQKGLKRVHQLIN